MYSHYKVDVLNLGGAPKKPDIVQQLIQKNQKQIEEKKFDQDSLDPLDLPRNIKKMMMIKDALKRHRLVDILTQSKQPKQDKIANSLVKLKSFEKKFKTNSLNFGSSRWTFDNKNNVILTENIPKSERKQVLIPRLRRQNAYIYEPLMCKDEQCRKFLFVENNPNGDKEIAIITNFQSHKPRDLDTDDYDFIKQFEILESISKKEIEHLFWLYTIIKKWLDFVGIQNFSQLQSSGMNIEIVTKLRSDIKWVNAMINIEQLYNYLYEQPRQAMFSINYDFKFDKYQPMIHLKEIFINNRDYSGFKYNEFNLDHIGTIEFILNNQIKNKEKIVKPKEVSWDDWIEYSRLVNQITSNSPRISLRRLQLIQNDPKLSEFLPKEKKFKEDIFEVSSSDESSSSDSERPISKFY